MKAAKKPKKAKVELAPVVRVAAPPMAAPSSRVTVALPFSQVKMHEPSQEISDLVTLVADLLDALEDTLPRSHFQALADRAAVLRTRLS